MSKTHRKPASLERKQSRYGYLFIFPLILGAAVFFIPNMIMTFVYSINDIQIGEGGYTLSWVGFANYYTALFSDRDFTWNLLTSVGDLITDIPVIVIFSLFISTVLNQKFRGRVFARVIFFIPVLLATGIIAKIEDMNALTMGDRVVQTGTALDSFQMAGMQDLLSTINLPSALTDIIVGAANSIYRVVQSSGIQIFIFLAGLQEIPPSLYEAAKVEGCSGWELFWKITIPMISPLIIVNSVYTIVDTFTRYGNPMVSYISNITASSSTKYGVGTAMYMLYFICIAVIIAVAGLLMVRVIRGKDKSK